MSVKGPRGERSATWGFGDESKRLTYGWALALAFHVGWKGKDQREAVAVMTAESGRYPEAWHRNYPGSMQESTDWGLYQINDKWHPTFDLDRKFDEVYNATYASGMWKASGFRPWMAYLSNAYLKYMPEVLAAYTLGRWKAKVPRVEEHFAR
jgi:hypothetical protein